MRHWATGIWFILLTAPAVARDLPLHLIKLPPGFKIELYAANVPNARSMTVSSNGTLFVGSRHAGKVYAVQDTNGNGRGDKVYVLAAGLNMPNGVAFYNGSLYVAEVNRILRFDDIERRLLNPPEPVVVSTDFPVEQHHGWKFIRIGPDEKLYVPIGAPCNVCIEYGYAVITRLNLDGSRHEIYAEGVRNTVGFDWHPDSRELWFTDNGRDQLGDELPPDELNRVPDEGMHFGFPYCHGGEVLDPEFGLGHRCNEYVAPAQKLGAHVAALGMRFYIGNMFPEAYRKQIFIAEHGSWNRSKKTGYRLSLVTLKGNRAISYESFAEGWLQGEKAWGRPVDIEHMADGSLLVSDDQAGAIYRISYTEGSSGIPPVKRSVIRQATPTVEQETPPAPPAPSGQTSTPISQPDNGNMIGIEQGLPSQTNLTPPLMTPPDVSLPENKIEALPELPSSDDSQTGNTGSLKLEDTATEMATEQPVESEVVVEPGRVPPADVIEKIRARTEQGNSSAADPFSPVKKQTINQ